ncbi:MAG: isochorismatase family protein [Propionibacteriaceae bacterium]|jgi:nicotinamidase-related amidase|nr:isochorismatase family protein [Propionibacteriaceae bacterium]
MTTLANRPDTALLVIDCQNGIAAGVWRRDAVMVKIVGLVDDARRRGVPVVWVQHSNAGLPYGSHAWEIVPELVPADAEPIVHKRFGDSFEDTDLGQVLARLGVGRLVVCGAETDACVLSTLFGAFVRGYDVTLVGDAHTTEDQSVDGLPAPAGVIATVNLLWQDCEVPGRTAQVVNADSVEWA